MIRNAVHAILNAAHGLLNVVFDLAHDIVHGGASTPPSSGSN